MSSVLSMMTVLGSVSDLFKFWSKIKILNLSGLKKSTHYCLNTGLNTGNLRKSRYFGQRQRNLDIPVLSCSRDFLPETIFLNRFKVCGCTFVTTINSFFAYRFISGLLTGTLTVLCFIYGNELLPKSVWSMTGNVMPCVFALGIAALGRVF